MMNVSTNKKEREMCRVTVIISQLRLCLWAERDSVVAPLKDRAETNTVKCPDMRPPPHEEEDRGSPKEASANDACKDFGNLCPVCTRSVFGSSSAFFCRTTFLLVQVPSSYLMRLPTSCNQP